MLGSFMQESYLTNIRLILRLGPIYIRVRRTPYPPHWKSGQQLHEPLSTLGDQIKKHHLEFHLLQADVAKALEVHVVSISDWERGVSLPSERIQKRIREFLNQGECANAIPKKQDPPA